MPVDGPEVAAGRRARHAIFLDGAIGTGKSTLGRALAVRLAGAFIEGDDFADPDKPWYCSSLRTSRSIVRRATDLLATTGVVVVAYPLRCANRVFFGRTLEEAAIRPLFVGLHAGFEAIVDPVRGRAFTADERDRIRVMIAEGYGAGRFNDFVVESGATGFGATLATLEERVREAIARPLPRPLIGGQWPRR